MLMLALVEPTSGVPRADMDMDVLESKVEADLFDVIGVDKAVRGGRTRVTDPRRFLSLGGSDIDSACI
jgi:hypothetical protein